MYLAFFILPFLCLIPLAFYLYICIARLFRLFSKPSKKWKRGLAIAATAVCLYFSWPIFRTSAMFIYHFFVVGLLLELLYWIIRKHVQPMPGILDVLYRSSAVTFVLVLLIMGYGFYNIHHVQEKDYTVFTDKLDHSMRAAAISDLHLGNTMDAAAFEGYCRTIEGKHPDFFVLAGDIFDESTRKSEMQKAAKILGNVKSTYGTYYVLGNHDPNHYTQNPQYSMEEMCRTLEEAGVYVLRDNVLSVGGMNLIGRLDAAFPERKSTKELMGFADSGKFTFLLDHQPIGLQENAKASVDLQLSGHTHAGQIWPTGTIMQWLGVSELNYGHKKIGKMDMIVTSGIGGWGYPIRTGGHSEYVIIDILPKQADSREQANSPK